jgi:uncharacterized protein DUF5522/cysteine-rich CWC protein
MNAHLQQPMTADRRCPVCGGANECRIANGCLYKDACWCEAIKIPERVRRFLAGSQPEPACLCERCLKSVARHAASCDEPEKILALVRAEMLAPPALTDEDYYLDAEGRTVFTAMYHLKRGYCCESGCRHCPYPKKAASAMDNP